MSPWSEWQESRPCKQRCTNRNDCSQYSEVQAAFILRTQLVPGNCGVSQNVITLNQFSMATKVVNEGFVDDLCPSLLFSPKWSKLLGLARLLPFPSCVFHCCLVYGIKSTLRTPKEQNTILWTPQRKLLSSSPEICA